MKAREVPMPSETVSVDQFAQVFDLHRTTVYSAVKRGELPAVRVGRRIRIPRVVLDRLLRG